MRERPHAVPAVSHTRHVTAVQNIPQKNDQERSAWVKERASLKRFSGLLQRDIRQSFYSTGSDLRQPAGELLELEEADAERRRFESDKARRRLEAQKVTLSNVKSWVQSLVEGKHDDVPANLESIMGELENDLYRFKRKIMEQRHELSDREKELSAEVNSLEVMLKEWEKSVKGKCPTHRKGGVAGITGGQNRTGTGGGAVRTASRAEDGGVGEDPGEDHVDPGKGGPGYAAMVERINDLIAREGGATGGWPLHEHESFLRIWTQAKGGVSNGARPPPSSSADRPAVSMLVERASALLPTRDAYEVEGHLAWHERHKGYLEEKKRLVKAWRDARLLRDEGTGVLGSRDSNRSDESPRGENLREATAAREGEAKKKKEKVEAWRAAKEAEQQRREEVEEKKRLDEVARGEETRRRQRRMREQIAAYRLAREREDARRLEVERMLAKEERVHSQVNLEERARRGVEEARRRCQESNAKDGQRQALQENMKAAVSAKWRGLAGDRARVMRATKASKEKTLQPEDLDDREDARTSLPAHCSRIALTGRDLRFVGRAVPAWRKHGCP
ncbi:unnamed protein product [Ascophyllum nodosum]